MLFRSIQKIFHVLSLVFTLLLLGTWDEFFELQVGVIGNLVHSSPDIKKEVLLAGALQPVIGLLRCIFTSHSGKLLCSFPFLPSPKSQP